ncbi:MAG: molybdopterin-guanine dinucleotide biosynthesis protein B [Alphaproteobacteria bacterium]
MMRVVGIVGWHDSGKTTLMVTLVAELVARGHRVSTVKHAHHGFDVDTPGKDSWKHRDAGATEVMVGSAARWALMHELRGDPEPSLDALLATMNPVDLVLVEGFKHADHAKIEVYRAGLDEPPLARGDATIVALADAGATPDIPEKVARLDPGDPVAVADFIERHWDLPRRRAETA